MIDVHRDWAPAGADRFYTLVSIGFFTDVAFFRVIDGFMAQTGIHGDGRVNSVWRGHHPRRSASPAQHARHGELRDVWAEFADDAVLHQLR